MTDYEIVRLCSAAMEVPESMSGFTNLHEARGGYWPLTNDAQAMALAWWLMLRGSLSVLTTSAMPPKLAISAKLSASYSNSMRASRRARERYVDYLFRQVH